MGKFILEVSSLQECQKLKRMSYAGPDYTRLTGGFVTLTMFTYKATIA